MELNRELERMAYSQGAEYFGVADLNPALDFIRNQGGDIPASFPMAVSVGITLPAGLTEPLLNNGEDHGLMVTYDRYVYQVCNLSLDTITFNLSRKIERKGYRAMPVAASLRVPGKYLAGVFPHKLAANLAGMGWIGKSCLLITPKDGPRVRWGTVLTDAPLTAGKPLTRHCGKCKECIQACPAGALKGRHFDPSQSRGERIDVEKCELYRNNLKKITGVRSCGKCIAACPFGRPPCRRKAAPSE